MSFQGDVAGIGLGELLQGLARGGRDGVLTLDGKHLSAALGLKGGRLYVLEGPDEQEDQWRERADQAWAEDVRPQLETSRRAEIARAHRLEIIYRMLEAENLSFRFEPGPLPVPRTLGLNRPTSLRLSDQIGETDNVEAMWGPPLTVEYLLLEHARLADEISKGPAAQLEGFDVPRALDPSRYEPRVRDFLVHCDGNSTLQEIADRLGISLTECRCRIGEHVREGNVRVAEARELLAAAQRELEHGHFARAATRIAGWLRRVPPGPPPAGDAQLLTNELDSSRLRPVLAALPVRAARGLLRRLDHFDDDLQVRRRRWRDLHEAQRTDEITLLRDIALRLVTTDEPEGRTYHDLLRLARSMQERGFKRRTRTLLRLAANNLPPRPQMRVELGRRMLDAGLVHEGKAWLLDTAREMIAGGDGERGQQAVREVLKRDSDNEEATGLLIQAQALVAKRRRRRWNALVGLSGGLVLSLVAFVKFHRHRTIEKHLDEVSANLHDPEHALELLELYFPEEEQPEAVTNLESRVRGMVREQRRAAMEAWNERYRDVEEECLYGDPVLALRRITELPEPPFRDGTGLRTNERQDLLGVLASRLGERSHELDLPVTAGPEDLKSEERLMLLVDELIGQVDPEASEEELLSFRFRMVELREQILDRREKRAAERTIVQEKEKAQEQDILLATARAHEQAGDLQRSILAYERLFESDPSLAQVPALKKEVARVRAHWEAVQNAVLLSQEGRHDEAIQELSRACPRPIEHMLPWRVDSRPSGARVTMPYGQVRRTPFVAQSGIGEHVAMTLELPGYESRSVEVNRPTELVVHLHRAPERAWTSEHRIEAVPVPVGDDHIVADRFGRVLRLTADNSARWERNLSTLGGIGRTPVFLPGKPGYLLVLSEDGQAWLIHSSTGDVVGPRDIGAPPRDGPTVTRSGVTASFTDGRVAVWTAGLEPTFYDADALVPQDVRPGGSDTQRSGTMVVLDRRLDLSGKLESPWTHWTVSVLDDEYRVVEEDGRGFTARRSGEWVFVSWEAPNALIPSGRLWVSDGDGLRSYLPDGADLVTYEN